jgi:hypothetical protein
MFSVNLLSGGPLKAIFQQSSEGRVIVNVRFCSVDMVVVAE